MRFKLPDGHEISGRSYTDVVSAMADMKIVSASSLAVYRKATARRARERYGAEVNPTDDRTFVRSLLQEGLLEEAR